ncbi:hypothetical protein M3484_13395 [Pseudomonas sp. GX19020]|uniref:hypothetical protein n=1 Tax=Pseudomonas sp. GX19020 TaxID=2942277 RepID=UPI0020184CFE|nr:hypothetical protein [Pseudomonas sp. GX19020]MCL4067566.1 hypothetical protein [Pseudomonas sp. GX19020]
MRQEDFLQSCIAAFTQHPDLARLFCAASLLMDDMRSPAPCRLDDFGRIPGPTPGRAEWIQAAIEWVA